MAKPDLILLHPPSVFRFRELPLFRGPVSDVVPSSSVFEIYPIGFLTISEYLDRKGISVRIVNLALKMLGDRSFDPEAFVETLDARAFGIDLHWLPHVDGALSLAELLKKRHPGKPVILGGLSATYFSEEIMRDYPFVDFVLRGDSTEEPLRQLMLSIEAGRGVELVPNLVWRDETGAVRVNEFSHRPETLDNLSFDYRHLLKMAIRYHDPSGYLPFHYWLTYPVTAVFQCRGCRGTCASCAGSAQSFNRVCGRQQPSFRAPELLARDIQKVSDFTGAPIMVIGDLLQGGEAYGQRFLESLRGSRIENEVTIEFFTPPPPHFVRKVAEVIPTFNVEISPESHDPVVRKAFGKHYDNAALERSLEALIEAGCKRIDLFFLVGLPMQDYASVMETVAYCEELIERYGGSGRLLPMISPLAPFIDPGSSIFEYPERYGYRLFARTLAEHRQAMLMPSWKYTLNYETRWMTRDEIVRATYDAALGLAAIKERHGIVSAERAAAIRADILKAKELMQRIDETIGTSGEMGGPLREEIIRVNNLDTLCGKHELDWPLKGWRLVLMRRVMKTIGPLILSCNRVLERIFS